MKRTAKLGWLTGLCLAGFVGGPANAQALDPYQNMGAINSATCPNAQCIISFPGVPQGKRLVLTSVSAQLGPAANSFVLEGSGVTYFVSKPDPNIGVLAVPITLYYGPGSVPTARIFAPNTAQNTSLVVTVVGYLVPVP